jgi:DNA-binding NtrC family response regulator
METTAAWNTQDMEAMTTAPSNGSETEEHCGNGRNRLRALALQLLQEVQIIDESVPGEEVPAHNLDGGIDFYDEVRRFEIGLIRRALRQTAGHQSRAAKLLKLKVSTLNAKIKHYNLQVMEFTNGHSLIKTSVGETRQVA